CNKGIFSIRRQDLLNYTPGKSQLLSCQHYGTMDGMKSRECNGGIQPAGWKSRDGKLWFPTIKGVTVINPDDIKINKTPPPVVIEKIVVDDKTFDKFEKVFLPPEAEKFEFHYSGLSLYAPDKVLFKFIIVGLDRDWVEAGLRRIAYYTNIPPGDYTFIVRACNSDGIWNTTGASVSFQVAPYFYQTKWFYGMCIVLLLLSGWGAIKFRVRKHEVREKELEALVDERTKNLLEVTRQLEDANQELQKLSATDSLTGIANRRTFKDFLASEWKRSFRLKTPLALIMIDIDFFKLYNDTYGHQSGDECLKKVAKSIANSVNRPGDLAVRYGGEEFVVVLFNTDKEGGASLAEKIRLGIENLNIVHDKSPLGNRVTVSIGLAAFKPTIGLSVSDLIARADEALYLAKRKGRNCLVVAD
ncbi:diguanylate cyclase, partial [candidate division CSSED10-310 bacterium]